MSLVHISGCYVSVQRYEPSRGQIWDGPYNDKAEQRTALTSSHIEWKDTPEAHVCRVHLPGLRPDEVKVEVEEEKRAVIITRGKEMERSTGRMVQRLSLPENARMSHVKAFMDKGVLSITVPKYEVVNYYNQARRPLLVHISGN